MIKKFDRRSIAIPLVVLAAAFGVGGTALAAGSHNAPASASSAQADVPTAGDKADSTADVPTAGDKADTDHSSEVVDGDGPGGHADEAPSQR